MAHARTLKNQKYHVVAVIGDGALTGGMAYEALSSAGTSRRAAARGAQRQQYVDRARMSADLAAICRACASVRSICVRRPASRSGSARIPGGGTITRAVIALRRRKIKRAVLPTSLFEQMGFTYLGPVDGHDLKSVCEFLALAKKMKKPVLLHVMTQKGRGYAPSEQ